MFLILFPGQLQQVLERELAVDLRLVMPSPPRYHAGSPASDRDGGAAGRLAASAADLYGHRRLSLTGFST
jgi:hypothetical protein